ncbi:MAG: HlyD family secretion protein [Geminicoccaceae bacterium]|nr:HlyD family secretion protein [Geminicoccaceae bacterium]MCB9942348.1 HlyD family secretion protein [Geminicoccaceae bacterium]
MKKFVPYMVTMVVVLVAMLAVAFRYYDYLVNPWTRDGQVMANIIRVAPRISGPIVELPIRDNQPIKAGELLFRVDPRTFLADLRQAEANYDQTVQDIDVLRKKIVAAEAGVTQKKASVREAESEVVAAASTVREAKGELDRNAALVQKRDVSRARFDQVQRDYDVDVASKQKADAALAAAESALAQSEAQLAEARAELGADGDGNSRIRAAAATVETARLNLSFTDVKASVDGYITNLELRIGSQAVANQPMLALIDRQSYWIDAFFRETIVADIAIGNKAVVTLMGYSDKPLKGVVDSIGWGIAKSDGSTSSDLLPEVSPTFQWIRLAQRIPVRIHLTEIPADIQLRVGQTASVLVMTGTGSPDRDIPAAPPALQ